MPLIRDTMKHTPKEYIDFNVRIAEYTFNKAMCIDMPTCDDASIHFDEWEDGETYALYFIDNPKEDGTERQRAYEALTDDGEYGYGTLAHFMEGSYKTGNYILQVFWEVMSEDCEYPQDCCLNGQWLEDGDEFLAFHHLYKKADLQYLENDDAKT